MSKRTAIYGSGAMVFLLLAVRLFAGGWEKIDWKVEKGKEGLAGFKTVFFINEKVGWIGGVGRPIPYHTPIPYFLHTNDGGENWYNLCKKGKGLGASQIWFSDENNGWMVGSGSWIYQTKDGGYTWKKVFQCDWAATQCLCDVTFPHDKKHGWVSGNQVIASTVDGGETWSPGIAGVDKQTGEPKFPYGNTFSLCFPKDNKIGWASSIFIIHTEDGGWNWAYRPGGLWRYHKNIYKVVFSKDLQRGWAVAEYAKREAAQASWLHGPILFTVDGGKTWHDAAQPYTEALYNVALVDDEKGELWAVGEKGTILHSTNGKSWEKVESTTEENLRGIFFVGNAGWIVGDNGTVLKYTKEQ